MFSVKNETKRNINTASPEGTRPSAMHSAPSPSWGAAHPPQARHRGGGMGGLYLSPQQAVPGGLLSLLQPASARASEWGTGRAFPSLAQGESSGAAEIGKGLGHSKHLQQPPCPAAAHSAPRWADWDAHPSPAPHAERPPTRARSPAARMGAVCINSLAFSPLLTFRRP
ncbi:Lengsin [Platysternon megacephalum]|uniref:Lengsin n=1 Tax=Platysternon megacephalum TaxID=55544 RepID=A0A4D9E194_9SAUR|nr:Lengsin [Platysternon megacephalum]